MAIVTTDDKHYKAIADAIRSKIDVGALKPEEMAAAIEGISSGGEPIVGATNMSYMFSDSAATTLDLRLLDTSNVTTMAYMFRDSAATVLDLSSFDTSNVTNMSYMFRNTMATTLDLSSFDTLNVTNMSGMFYGSMATTLDLSSFDTSSVTNMGSMFWGSKATTLDLSSFDTSSVTNMSYMFRDSKATTGYARTQADADRFNASSYKPEGLTFYVAPYVMAQDSDFDGTANGSFKYIGSHKYVIIPHVIKGVNVTSYYEMFSDTSTTLKGVASDNLNITTMGNIFYRSQATSLDLSNFDTSNVTSMSRMFYDSQATTLDLSSFDTSKVTTMYAMFESSRATTLDLSSFNTSKVTNMAYMFYNSKATTGYARTQADADRFNASSNKPAGLTFVVK